MENKDKIKYAIKSNKKATIFGIDPDESGNIHVPDFIESDGVQYPVDLVAFGCTRRMDYNRAKRVFIPCSITNVYFDNPYIREVHFIGDLESLGMLIKICDSLESISIHGSVKRIGYKALDGCKNLKRITIDKGPIPEINCLAFRNCSSLETILIDNKPIKLEHVSNTCCLTAFCGCYNFQFFGDNLKIDNGLLMSSDGKILYTILGKSYDSGEYLIPDSVEEMLHCLSYNKLRLIDFSQSKIEKIEDNSFEDCSTLEEVILPQRSIGIGRASFRNCTKLHSVINFDMISKLGGGAFSKSGITTCFLSSDISEIPHSAFRGCNNLQEVKIPLSVKSIFNNAFEECKSIKYLQISEEFKDSLQNVFENLGEIDISFLPIKQYVPKRTDAFTHGVLSCPYCGSSNVQTYTDGTAQCYKCNGEYRYWR